MLMVAPPGHFDIASNPTWLRADMTEGARDVRRNAGRGAGRTTRIFACMALAVPVLAATAPPARADFFGDAGKAITKGVKDAGNAAAAAVGAALGAKPGGGGGKPPGMTTEPGNGTEGGGSNGVPSPTRVIIEGASQPFQLPPAPYQGPAVSNPGMPGRACSPSCLGPGETNPAGDLPLPGEMAPPEVTPD